MTGQIWRSKRLCYLRRWHCSIQQSFVEHVSFTRHWGYERVVDIVPTLQFTVSGVLGRQVALVQLSKRYGGGRYRVL